MQFLPFILIFVIFYFLLIRPQQKQRKQHQQLLDNLKTGDKVVTASGIYASIVKLGDERVTLDSAAPGGPHAGNLAALQDFVTGAGASGPLTMTGATAGLRGPGAGAGALPHGLGPPSRSPPPRLAIRPAQPPPR